MAVHRSIGGRDPLPYPKLECDDSFIGKREIRVNLLFLFVCEKKNYFVVNRNCRSQQALQMISIVNHGSVYSIQTLYLVQDIKCLTWTLKHQMIV